MDGSPENFRKIKELGLEAVEAAFTYGVWLTREKAESIRKANKQFGLKISVHAPCYINLNAESPGKKDASMQRIMNSAEIGHCLGAKEIVFHPGFYMKDSAGRPASSREHIKKASPKEAACPHQDIGIF